MWHPCMPRSLIGQAAQKDVGLHVALPEDFKGDLQDV